MRTRTDALPEYADYTDSGCEVSPSCLRCPLARCIHDEPERRVARRQEIAVAHRCGISVDQLAARFEVSRRTVFRAIRHGSD